MSEPTSLDSAAQLRNIQIVLVALALGVALFAGVAAFVGPVASEFRPEFHGKDVLAIVAVCVSLQAIPLSFLIPAKWVKGARDRDPETRRRNFRGGRIVAGAVCEAAALLWCVALLLTGNLWYLPPIAVLVALIVWHIPSRDSFEEATGQRVPNT